MSETNFKFSSQGINYTSLIWSFTDFNSIFATIKILKCSTIACIAKFDHTLGQSYHVGRSHYAI